MIDNNSELSKPVAWRYRYTKPGITDSNGEAWVGDWKFFTDEVNCNPAPNYQKCALYSQEYVSALLADRDAWQASALALRDELRTSQAIANEYQQLMYHMDAGGDFYEFQRDKAVVK